MISKPAYAKINLTLDIVGRREDGYHLLETVMQTVSLCDRVSVERADNIEIVCSAEGVPTNEKNTCHKAARLFFEQTGTDGGVRIIIDKKIPSEAGLGGGSSDAAATLCLLNELYDTHLSYEELERIGAKVGADVAFCIRGGTVLCQGIGDEMTKLEALPKRYVLLVKPDFGVSTPEAYKQFDKKGMRSCEGTKAFVDALNSNDVPYLNISNDLEIALGNDMIEKIRDGLIDLGAEAAQMTGSGSCVFGLFVNKCDAENARRAMAGKYPFCELCETI